MTDTENGRPRARDGRTEERDAASLPPDADNAHADTLARVLDPFARRLLQEAMAAALPFTWLRRAQELDDARPRTDEFHGAATRAQLSERWRSLTDAAEGCRRHARFLAEHPDALGELIAGDVDALMREVV